MRSPCSVVITNLERNHTSYPALDMTAVRPHCMRRAAQGSISAESTLKARVIGTRSQRQPLITNRRVPTIPNRRVPTCRVGSGRGRRAAAAGNSAASAPAGGRCRWCHVAARCSHWPSCIMARPTPRSWAGSRTCRIEEGEKLAADGSQVPFARCAVDVFCISPDDLGEIDSLAPLVPAQAHRAGEIVCAGSLLRPAAAI
jgi:hypothetical protein